MVRIHVVRASRLLLGAGIAVLLAVVLWLAGRALLGGELIANRDGDRWRVHATLPLNPRDRP